MSALLLLAGALRLCTDPLLAAAPNACRPWISIPWLNIGREAFEELQMEASLFVCLCLFVELLLCQLLVQRRLGFCVPAGAAAAPLLLAALHRRMWCKAVCLSSQAGPVTVGACSHHLPSMHMGISSIRQRHSPEVAGMWDGPSSAPTNTPPPAPPLRRWASVPSGSSTLQSWFGSAPLAACPPWWGWRGAASRSAGRCAALRRGAAVRAVVAAAVAAACRGKCLFHRSALAAHVL